jgi:Short C-terminal domain
VFGKKKNILMNGVQARAVVTRVDDTGMTINNNPRVKLTLQVQPDGDVPFEVTKKMTVSRLSIPNIGTTIWVRYDAEDKSKVEIDQAKNDEAGASAAPAAGTGATSLGTFPIAGATFTTTIDGGSAVIDARNVPGLRDELMKAVHDVQAGGNPAELRDAVMKAMSQGTAINMPAGGAIPGGAAPGGALTPPAPAADPLDQLSKLADLRKSGVLTEAEFEAQKAKILGEM